jgi:hypothetical protein
VEDEVVLIGTTKNDAITAEDLAALSGTISYEIVCGLGSRVPRVYVYDKPSSAAYPEKRNEIRTFRRLAVRLMDYQTNLYMHAQAEDVSAHGMGLMTTSRLLPGKPVGVQVHIPGDGPMITGHGTIAWAHQETGGEYRAGIALDDIDLAQMLRQTPYQIDTQEQNNDVA